MNALATIPAWLLTAYPDACSSLPAWLIDFQQKQRQVFLAKGLPTQKDESWKYADLTLFAHHHFLMAAEVDEKKWQAIIQQYRFKSNDEILLVLINGRFMPCYSDIEKLPTEVIALRLLEAINQYPELVKANWLTQEDTQNHPFANLNTSSSLDGIFFYVPDGYELERPVHLLSLVSEQHEFIAQLHHMIMVGNQAKLKWMEEYEALSSLPYVMNIINHIIIGKNGQLDYYKKQNENKKSVHIAHTLVKQLQNSTLSLTSFLCGGLFARDEIKVKLIESGASCHTGGYYGSSEDNQYVDYHVDIYHLASYSISEMLYKGTIDKKSRAVFNGKLYVEKDIQKILAHQTNHNLLLSKEAEIYSKPELEIYADDVKCKHGASIGQINHEALFYLRSRGISHSDALAILREGFANDIVQRIKHPEMQMRIQEML